MGESENAQTLEQEMQQLGRDAVKASRILALAHSASKSKALVAAAACIRARADEIIAANKVDLEAAQARGLKPSFIDRLTLTADRIEAMAAGVDAVAQFDDPVGRELEAWNRPNGLRIRKVSVPLGVIGVIYESRPNVTADAAALCLKAGNATILRGGSDSFYSSGVILDCMQQGFVEAGLPASSVQRVPTTDRAAVGLLLKMSDHVDVIVPRGGKGLIERIQNESRIPVFSHLDGINHSYVDAIADLTQASDIVVNAKMRRTGICGATETLLVHRAVAQRFLPMAIGALRAKGCEIRGDRETALIVPDVLPATDADWGTEYLDAILSVKVVENVDEAIEHINQHGSHHTEAILSSDPAALAQFSAEVDAGIILQNASTQFADGGEFGMGGEIGISTGKMHARGPVGARELTSYKYIVEGSGQTRP